MRSWTIYTLSDPETLEVRYVGVSHCVRARFSQHLYSPQRRRTRCAIWIKSLLRRGLKPLLSSIEKGVGPGWTDTERRWIAFYRAMGAQLTNLTDGGEGTLGWRMSDVQRQKRSERMQGRDRGKVRSPAARQNMREAQLARFAWEQANGIKRTPPPRSEDTRRRMAEAQRGKQRSAEHRAKLSELHRDPNGPYQTDEYRRKQREAFLRRPEDERRAMSANQKGVPKSEAHRRKIGMARLGWSPSETTREKIGAAHRGLRHSEETKRKIRESCRRAWLIKQGEI